MYLGPETIVPLASALAAIGGLLMMFWHRVLGYVRAVAGFISRSIGGLLVRR